jgi:uncharacterized membrane protein
MESRAKLFGHPIHQMLIVLPLGLLTGAVIFDVIRLLTSAPQFGVVSFWLIAAGVVSGLLAAVFGLVDWLAIPAGTRARRVGALHAVGNGVVVALFAVSWLMRRGAPESPPTLAIVLSLAGGALSVVTGWLGGELVDRLGVGVDDGAHLNAPSSLSRRSAGEQRPSAHPAGD